MDVVNISYIQLDAINHYRGIGSSMKNSIWASKYFFGFWTNIICPFLKNSATNTKRLFQGFSKVGFYNISTPRHNMLTNHLAIKYTFCEIVSGSLSDAIDCLRPMNC